MVTEDEGRQMDRIARAPRPTDQDRHLLLLRQNLEEANALAPTASPILAAIERALDNLTYVESIRASGRPATTDTDEDDATKEILDRG